MYCRELPELKHSRVSIWHPFWLISGLLLLWNPVDPSPGPLYVVGSCLSVIQPNRPFNISPYWDIPHLPYGEIHFEPVSRFEAVVHVVLTIVYIFGASATLFCQCYAHTQLSVRTCMQLAVLLPGNSLSSHFDRHGPFS